MKRITALGTILVLTFIVHAQQSYNMSKLGEWTDNSLPTSSDVRFNDVWGYSAGGREYALLGSLEKIHFIDITSSTNPVEIAAIGAGARSIWRDMKTYGQYAYSIADRGAEGLLVFDLGSLPNTVTLANQITTEFPRAHNISIAQSTGKLYVWGAPENQNRDLIVYDLTTDPSAPQHIASISLPGGYVHDAFVEGNTIYCSHREDGLYIYDASPLVAPPPGEPVGSPELLGIIDNYFNPGYNHSSWVSGNIIVFADETHGSPMSIAYLNDYEDIQEESYFQSNLLGVSPSYGDDGPLLHNPFIIGNLCYVSHYHDGVAIFDISNPAQVRQLAYYDTEPNNTDYSGFQGCWGAYPFLPSGRIIASDVLNGLFILDFFNTLPPLPLPVEWGTLDVHTAKEGIVISWTTLEETDNRGFFVERRRADGAFERLDFVESSVKQEYRYIDTQPWSGQNIYRLVQEDYDGAVNYSKLVSASWDVGAGNPQIYPNPAKSGEVLYFRETAEFFSWPMELLDATGRVRQLWTRPQNITSKVQLSLPNTLEAGVFWLKDSNEKYWHLIIHE